MDKHKNPTYEDLKQAAESVGEVEEPCMGCKGKGVSERPSANEPDGVLREDPCSLCEGVGRVWVLPRGALGVVDSDRQLWEKYQAWKRGASPG